MESGKFASKQKCLHDMAWERKGVYRCVKCGYVELDDCTAMDTEFYAHLDRILGANAERVESAD